MYEVSEAFHKQYEDLYDILVTKTSHTNTVC